MSYTKPGKRREGDGGLATLDPEQPPDDKSRCESHGTDTPARSADDKGKCPRSDSAAGGKNDPVADVTGITMADMAARIARCYPRGGMPDVLVDCLPGIDVIRTPSREETGTASTGRDRNATGAGDLVHTIWIRLCLLLVLGLNGVVVAVANELAKMDAV